MQALESGTKAIREETNDELLEASEISNDRKNTENTETNTFWHHPNNSSEDVESHMIFSSYDYSLYFDKIADKSQWIHVRYVIAGD